LPGIDEWVRGRPAQALCKGPLLTPQVHDRVTSTKKHLKEGAKRRDGVRVRTRSSFRLAHLAWASVLVAMACSPSSPPPHPTPGGIVLITIDTLRADAIGSYGGPAETPAMDAMAEMGVLVERAYTPTPTTGPAHASLFTGLHPWRHRVLFNALPLDETLPTLAETLRDSDFQTAAFVSSYMLHPRFRFDRGFESYRFEASVPFNFHGQYIEEFYAKGDETTRAARQWLLENASPETAPFFLWIHYFDPHPPWEPPPPHRVATGALVDMKHKTIPRGVRDPRQLANMIRAYRGEVQFVDAQVGQILEALRELGIEERTTVILTADHGEGLGDHGHLKHNVNLYGELIHVPLILKGPGLPRGLRLQGQAQLEDLFPTILSLEAQLEDLFPTILSLAGVENAEEVDGVDLAPWLRGEQEQSPREVVMGRRRLYPGTPDLYFQQMGQKKWIGVPNGGGAEFDLGRDAFEQSPRNVDGVPSRLAEAIAGTLDDSAGGQAREMDQRMREALEALGYIDDSSAREEAP